MFKLSIHVHPCHPSQQKTGQKFQFLNYIINILHIPMNAKLPKLHIYKATIPGAPNDCFL